MLVGKCFFSSWLVLLMRHNWRAPLKIFCRLKVSLIQFFPVALSVLFLLVYAKCNFASMFEIWLTLDVVRWSRMFFFSWILYRKGREGLTFNCLPEIWWNYDTCFLTFFEVRVPSFGFKLLYTSQEKVIILYLVFVNRSYLIHFWEPVRCGISATRGTSRYALAPCHWLQDHVS